MIYDALFSTKEISIHNAWKNLVEVFLELNDYLFNQQRVRYDR